MDSRGLMLLVAYAMYDSYLTDNPQITFFRKTYRRHTNFATEAIDCETSNRKYDNFDIIIDDTIIGKEQYYGSDLIHIFPINLCDLNCKPILVNSEKTIQQDKLKLKTVLKKEKREEKEREIEEEKERKKEERRNRNNGSIDFWSSKYRLTDANARSQRSAQNRQIKNQMKNQMRRR